MTRGIALFAVLFSTGAAGCGGSPTASRKSDSSADAEWTLLIYVEGDTNLEWPCVANLKGMVEAERSDRVRVVLQVDRSDQDGPEGDGYTGKEIPGVGNFFTTKRMILRGKQFEPIADLGKTDATDPKTIAEFIAWGAKSYPAKRTALIFMDHGAAWAGWGHDMSAQDNSLRIRDLGTALERGRVAAGSGPFDLLIFESCLMGSLEALRVVYPHARTVVASEEFTYIGGGRYWNAILSALCRDPEQDAVEFARLFVNEWKGYFDGHKKSSMREIGESLTLAVFDSAKIPGLVQATDALCDALLRALESGDRSALLRVAIARNAAEEYGGHDPEDSFQCRDLYQFAQGLVGLGAEVDRCRDAVLRAVEAATVHRLRGAKRAAGYSVSVLFPGYQGLYAKDTIAQAGVKDPTLAACPKWPRMLETLYENQGRDRTPPEMGHIQTGKRQLIVGESMPLRAAVKAEGVRECMFMLLSPWKENRYVVMGMYPVEPRDGQVDCDFDGTWPMVRLGSGGPGTALMRACVTGFQKAEEGKFHVTIPARYRAPGSNADRKLTLFYAVSMLPGGRMESATFLYAYEITPFGAVQVDFEEGGEIMTTVFVVDEKGKMEEISLVQDKVKMQSEVVDLVRTPLSGSRYLVGFRLTDLAGNAVLQSVRVGLVRELKVGVLSDFGPTRSGARSNCPHDGCNGQEREMVFCKEIARVAWCPEGAEDASKCAGVEKSEGADVAELAIFRSAKHTHHVLFKHALHCDAAAGKVHDIGGPIWRPEPESEWMGYECKECQRCFDTPPKDMEKLEGIVGNCRAEDGIRHVSHRGMTSKLKRHTPTEHDRYARENR